MDLPTASRLFDVAGKTVVVTGASSGLGARFATLFHESGARVVATARRVDRLTELAEALPGIGTLACDVTIADDRRRLVGETLDRHGAIDVLINNAGMSGPSVPAE